MRFTSWYARDLLYNKRKDSHWRYKADLTDRRYDLLALAKSEVDDGKMDSIAYVAADRNCTLYAMSTTGNRLDFSSETEFRQLECAIRNSCPRLSQYYNFLRTTYSSSPAAPNDPACDCTDCKEVISKNGKFLNTKTKVINQNDYFYKNINTRKCKDIIYIGRNSKWGNKFVGPNCIKEFEDNLPSSGLLGSLHELKGKTLACFCKPNPCHGDVLAKLADEA